MSDAEVYRLRQENNELRNTIRTQVKAVPITGPAFAPFTQAQLAAATLAGETAGLRKAMEAVAQVYGPWDANWDRSDCLRAWRNAAVQSIAALLSPPGPTEGGT